MRGLLVITLIGLLLVVAIASGLCPCSLDPKGSESISVNASLHAEPLKTTTSTTTTTIPKPNLGPGHKSKTKLELVRNEVSLTHACSYYEVTYSDRLGKQALLGDLTTLKISRAKEVYGKLRDITVEIRMREPYQVQVPIYGTCTGYVSLANLTNSTVKRCEDFNLTTYNETHCVYNYACVVDYGNETRYRWVWKPLRWHDFRGMAKRAYQAPRKVKDLLDFNKIRDLLWDSFERERKVEIRVCGNYQPEFTDGAWRVAIDHVPSFKDREFWKFTWWNASWSYRRPITITEQSGNTLTDYQVKLTIDTASLISEGKLRSDCGDIRFTDANDNEIPYWIEPNTCNSANTVIWVKVSYIPASSTTTIYMYYGNSDATSESNGDNVFEFFDDFEVDLSKWKQTKTSSTSVIQRTTEQAYSGSYSVEVYQTVDDGDTELYNDSLNYNTAVVVWHFYDDGGESRNHYLGADDSATIVYIGVQRYANNYHYIIGDTNYESSVARSTGWHEFKWIFYGSGVKGYIDGTEIFDTNSVTTLTRIGAFDVWTGREGWYQDTVYVRKFADPEPTITLGTEEFVSPVVESVVTYNETYGNQTTFSPGDKVIIRANVTHPLGNQYVDSAVITIIDNSSTVQVNNESMTLVTPFSGVYADWSYRRVITIAEQSGSTLTDYQVLLTLDTETLISENKLRSDCGDLRFTYYNETSGEEVSIPYWVESGCGTTDTKVWIKVPEIPANDNATVYMYYGNPDATSESNADEVFDLFDDFEGTSLDTSKWVDKNGGVTVENGYVKFAYVSNHAFIYTNQEFDYDVVVKLRAKKDGADQNLDVQIGTTDQACSYYSCSDTLGSLVLVHDGWDEGLRVTYKDADCNGYTIIPNQPVANTGEWHTYTLVFAHNVKKVYQDGVLKAQATDSHWPSTSHKLGVMAREGSGSSYVYVDWILVRKFADPEPSYEIGEEETLAEKLTFEYNYTIPSDAVGGTWRAIVYANDTNGNWGSNETTFEVVVDFEPPTITFVSQTPANLNESSTEPVTIIINITDPSGVNESRIAFFHGVNHTLGIAGTGFYHYNWSWRYPANDLQPDMRRADFRNMSYWFEEVVFKESPDDIWTFAGYDKTISEVFKIVDSGTNYTTVNITFFSAQMLFPQIFPFDKYYLTKENKTNQYVELYNNQWMKLKFYPKMFYNYTQENYTIYLDLNVDPSFTPNTRPLEIYFCNSSYTTGDPSKTSNCAYVEEIDSTDTRTIVIANSSYIQNVFYIADGYIDGVKVTDEAYLVLRTTAPPTQAFRLHYADDVINEYINFTNFGHAWVSSDNGNTWNPVSYTPDFYLIATQAERDKVMYYVYACDNYGNCANSTIQYDSLDPVNHPPGEPLIIEPAENATLTGLVNASWLTIGDPDFDPFNASIHLFYPDGTYFTTIAENIPGSNQQYNYTYEFNTSLYPTGTYRLNVTLCDSHGLCSSSITPYNFTIYHVYEQPLEQGMTTSAYLRRILGKGQIVAVIVYDYLARTFMGYREILTVTSVTEALRIVLVRELEELFTINIGFVEIPIKNLPVALTTTTELSTWFRQLRYLSDQLATSLTLAMEVVTLRVGEVSFSVSEAVARAVNMVRVSDLPVLISESLVKTIEVVREAEIAVTLAESLGKWIGVARIGEVAILMTDVMIRSINVAREMVAYLTSTVLLTVTRMETFLAQITVSDAVARVVIAVRPVVETISLILRFTLEYPAIPTFLLPAPPYALFAWATNIETLFVLLVAISVAIIVSTVYVFNKRHELFEHPTERFFGKKKKKR